jgi:2-iminobutanoate/2-iminopropanoate deaminase
MMSLITYADPPATDPPIGQYSQVSRVAANADLIHIAGQLPLNLDGSAVSEQFDAQAENVFRRLGALLEAAGSSMRHIAYLRTYLTRDSDYAAFKAVRERVFAEHGVAEPPPATTIVVAGLVGASLIELDAVATAAA